MSLFFCNAKPVSCAKGLNCEQSPQRTLLLLVNRHVIHNEISLDVEPQHVSSKVRPGGVIHHSFFLHLEIQIQM